jgi:hypothetical protein
MKTIMRILTTLFVTLFAVFVVNNQPASADISRFVFLEDGDGILEFVYDDELNLKGMVFYDEYWNIYHIEFGNPNPEDASSGMKGDYDSAVSLAKQNSELKGIVGGIEYDWANTPIGRHQTGSGKGKIPAHNPNPSDSEGASTPPRPLEPPDFDPGKGSVGGGSGWFDPNGGSPAGQLKKNGKKRGNQGDDDDGGSDPTGGDGMFGDLPGPPELVNPDPVSFAAAAKGSAESHVQVPVIQGLDSKKPFSSGDKIALQVSNAKDGLKGQVERYNGHRWVPFKQAKVRSRGKSGQSVQLEIKIKKQGVYRIRVGDKVSKKFAVKKDTVKMAPRSLKRKTFKGGLKPKQVVSKRTASAKIVSAKPMVKLK